MRTAISFTKTLSHGVKDFPLRGGLDVAIAPKNPHDTGSPISLTQPSPIGAGIVHLEDRRGSAASSLPLVTPSWQEPYVKAQCVRPLHDVVHMVPVVVLRPLLNIGARRIVVDQWAVPVGIGRLEPIQFSQRHCLDGGESLGRAVAQVAVRLFTVEPMK